VKRRALIRFIREEKGQAMTEYVVITFYTVIIGFLTVNKVIVPHLNDLFELIANLVSLPFP
jgi:Flp pilus assembly pilin Flp